MNAAEVGLSLVDEPWNLQHGPPRPTTHPPQLYSYLTPR